SHQNEGPSACLRGMARSSRQADRAFLRPLRRPTAGSARAVDESAFRARGTKRPPLRARRHRRQRPILGPCRGFGGHHESSEETAGERQVPGALFGNHIHRTILFSIPTSTDTFRRASLRRAKTWAILILNIRTCEESFCFTLPKSPSMRGLLR